MELTMTIMPTPETMNRTAKLFMDRGEAADYDTALARLQGFRLGIACGREGRRPRLRTNAPCSLW